MLRVFNSDFDLSKRLNHDFIPHQLGSLERCLQAFSLQSERNVYAEMDNAVDRLCVGALYILGRGASSGLGRDYQG